MKKIGTKKSRDTVSRFIAYLLNASRKSKKIFPSLQNVFKVFLVKRRTAIYLWIVLGKEKTLIFPPCIHVQRAEKSFF